MGTREEGVLDTKIVLLNVLAEYWRKSYKETVEIFETYDVLNFIDCAYEYFNSTGEQGIIEEIEDYIRLQKENRQ